MIPFPSREQTQAGETDGVLPAPASSSPLHSPSNGGEEMLAALLDSWLSLSGPREGRRFLQAHPEFLDPRANTILHERLVQAADDPKKGFQLRDALNLLRDAQARGGTVEAIQEAYINAHGGFSLDIPEWLEEVERQLRAWRSGGQPDQQAVATWMEMERQALTRAQAEGGIAPETLAALEYELAYACQQSSGMDWAQALEAALEACQAALHVYTVERYPLQYGRVQDTLGLTYRQRIREAKRDNVEQAITCFQKALHVFTLEAFPSQYAQTQRHLGIAYAERIAGERRENLEQTIACFRESLRVRTLEAFPSEYAQTQHSLGMAYRDRIAGEPRENLEHAIACFRESLRVRTLEAFPYEYAWTQHGLGVAYRDRIAGERRDNLEQAIVCFQEALHVYTLEAFPVDYALVLNSLSEAYWKRIAGERRDNIERAIACAHEALRVRTLEHFPFEYALTQGNLGAAYRDRIAGERRDNLEQAIVCFQEALRVRTFESFPYYYAESQHNLGMAYTIRIAGERNDNLEQAIACFQEMGRVWTLEAFPREHREALLYWAETEVQRANWAAVHDAYSAALEAEDLLVALGAGAIGRDAILREGRDAALRDGFALTRLGRVEEAAVAIERGRARGLAEAMAFDAADPERIGDPERRERYTTARQGLVAAQADLHAPLPPHLDEDAQRRVDLERTAAYRQARSIFDTLVAEVRAAGDPADLLHAPLDAATLLRATERGGPGHALAYLAATPWGGIAVAALGAHPPAGTSARFDCLELPALTETLLNDLLETRLDEHSDRVIGGFASAQTGSAFELLQVWPGTTVREQATALHLACQVNRTGTFDDAAQAILAIAALTPVVDAPIETLDEADQLLLAGTLNHAVLQRELTRCLSALAEAAFRPLLAWLAEQGIRSLTLIPCGPLAAFPLAAVPLAQRLNEALMLPISLAPNARSLLREEHTSVLRRGLYAVGDPRPSHQALPWSEAEALTLTLLGAQADHPAAAKVQWEATRRWLIEALGSGSVVDACCHGTFRAQDVLRSALLLANGERLTLGEMLGSTADLRGLRLLILSACQTAILDVRGARDEVRSLAAAMLQAGAQAVLAAHWAVDDRATYLLMVRFVQEWLPHMDHEPPALALLRAQRWLSTVTNAELERWEIGTLPHRMTARRQGADAEGGQVLPVQRGRLLTVRGRGTRYDVEAAQEQIHEDTESQDPQSSPYADPYYWAGFQVLGW